MPPLCYLCNLQHSTHKQEKHRAVRLIAEAKAKKFSLYMQRLHDLISIYILYGIGHLSINKAQRIVGYTKN